MMMTLPKQLENLNNTTSKTVKNMSKVDNGLPKIAGD